MRRARSLTFPHHGCAFPCLFKEDSLMWVFPHLFLFLSRTSPAARPASLPFLTPVCALGHWNCSLPRPCIAPTSCLTSARPLSLIYSNLRLSYQVYFLHFYSGVLCWWPSPPISVHCVCQLLKGEVMFSLELFKGNNYPQINFREKFWLMLLCVVK